MGCESGSTDWGTFFRNRKKSLIQIHILAQAEESDSSFGKRGKKVSQTPITSKKTHKIHSPQLRDLPFEILFQN